MCKCTKLLIVLMCIGAISCAGDGVRVGSKSFTESVILGEVAAQAARAAGARAEHRRQLGGTRVLWSALLAGEIDVYPEYTGTIAAEILPGAGGEEAMRAALGERRVVMGRPLGFDNTYAIGMKEELAARLGIRTLSDLARHPELKLGFSSEFMERADGWPALRDRYRLPQNEVTGLDHDLAYRGIDGGAIHAMDLYSTDAEIRHHGLRVLEDDLHHFPAYRAVLLYRADLERRAPAVVAALAKLEGRIPAREMMRLNARVKIERTDDAVAAAEFLRAAGIAGSGAGADGNMRGWRRMLGHALSHLGLVALSLAAAIVVAIPLGLLAARRRRVGQVVLGVVAIVQTIPSLALLVFMIPLLGIGAPPAVAALFLYSLLPIVRNTHAGLSGISPSLMESAVALGLPPGARLRLVELPLASPMILAGIKTSAVINVGTATLGALVGAGGLGQPILTGIRLDDVPLVLEGAAAAAVLALLVQALFELLERRLVPRGLRLK